MGGLLSLLLLLMEIALYNNNKSRNVQFVYIATLWHLQNGLFLKGLWVNIPSYSWENVVLRDRRIIKIIRLGGINKLSGIRTSPSNGSIWWVASSGEYTAWKGEWRGEEYNEGKGIKERKWLREGKGKGESGMPLPRYSPAQGGSLLPALDQDSLECEARISIWGIGRNV